MSIDFELDWTCWGLGFYVSAEAAFILFGPVGINICWRRP